MTTTEKRSEGRRLGASLGSALRISADRGLPKHGKEIGFLNDLIIDLKLQAIGRQVREPVTMERLEEATKHIGALMQCREQTRMCR